MRNPIIVALDVPAAAAALKLVEQLAPVAGGFKVGSELFTGAGPEIVRRIRERGALVFLDLKFHDIPNTVAKSVAAAVQLDVQMQLRREEEGEWTVGGSNRAMAVGSGSASASKSETSGEDDNDIVKRLMQQREQELK